MHVRVCVCACVGVGGVCRCEGVKSTSRCVHVCVCACVCVCVWYVQVDVCIYVYVCLHTCSYVRDLQMLVWCVAVCCSVLQYVAVCCFMWIVLQCVAWCCSALHTALMLTQSIKSCTQISSYMYRDSLQHTAAHCNTLQYTATHCDTSLRHILLWVHESSSAVNTCIRIIHIQTTATHCNTLQHTATHCETFSICKHMHPYYTHINDCTQTSLYMYRHSLQHTATHCNAFYYLLICQNVS